jgi:DNA-directed RNA polymerase subunit N (RpoN/RPB10)
MNWLPPIRCYTCSMPIMGKWKTYLDLVSKYRKQDGRPEKDELLYLTSSTKITAEGRAMTELGLTRECCRRHFFTHPGV